MVNECSFFRRGKGKFFHYFAPFFITQANLGLQGFRKYISCLPLLFGGGGGGGGAGGGGGGGGGGVSGGVSGV